ncbi:MAG: hypothetical protein IT348_13795 [Candidatus Eisenbacteria bacterium]|nr:hypothetical protein [Candidatus Eisenbacteria bacterium]
MNAARSHAVVAPARLLAIAPLVAMLALAASCAQRAPEPWQAVAVPTDADFSGMWFTDSLNGWVAGGGWAIEGGIVGRTRDGGRTWSFDSGIIPNAGERAAMGRVQFRDSLFGRATAGHAGVLLTDDGGHSWRPAAGASSSGLYDLHFIDPRSGWAAGTSVARTEDGGETWNTLTSSTGDRGFVLANAVAFTSATRGWAVGHGGSLRRTDDGGASWTPVALPLRAGERPILRGISFCEPDHGWIAGELGTIFRTRDGGTTWTLQESGVPIVRVIPRGEEPRPREVVPELETPPDRLEITAIRFADPANGWAVGSYSDVAESVVLRTSDGGETWRVEHVQPGEMLRSLFVLDAGHAWAAGDRARTQPQVILRYAPSGR